MNNSTDTHTDPCQQFEDQLDRWLGEELDGQQNAFMQTHHDSCLGCQIETRLAREIDTITQSLPSQHCPDIQLPSVTPQRSFPDTARAPSLFSQFLDAWRRPLVFGPALALLLIVGVFIQTHLTGTPEEPPLIVVNGEEYTPEEVIQAKQELELALEYLRKYSDYTTALVNTELRGSYLLDAQPGEDNADPSI
jgi:hypothetical protein